MSSKKIVFVGIVVAVMNQPAFADGASAIRQRLQSYHIVMEGSIEMTTILVHKVFLRHQP
jgi:hypothetical protein